MRQKPLKKPSRQPPPPPLPSREHVNSHCSLLCHNCNYGGGSSIYCHNCSYGGGSEYAESCGTSWSTRSHQPYTGTCTPNNQNQSCRSESGYPVAPCYNYTPRHPPHLKYDNLGFSNPSSFAQSPSASTRSLQSHVSASKSHICRSPVESSVEFRQVHSRPYLPKPPPKTPSPVQDTTANPMERKPRPRLSVSPQPRLKEDHVTTRHRYDRLHYIRFIEHLVLGIFKYLKSREERRKELEQEIPSQAPGEEDNIRQIYKMKESRYLRGQRRTLKIDDFVIKREIGAGYFGTVLLVSLANSDSVRSADSENLYAMKKCEKKKVHELKMMARLMAEKDFLSEADSDWIVKLYYSFQDINYLFFILEYVPGGDMMSLLMKLEVFPEKMAKFYIAEISLALQFVHDSNYVHRDIKPDNILIDSRGHIKLADFGLCTGFRWNHEPSYYESCSIENRSEQPDPVVTANHYEDHPTITKALTQRNIQHSQRRRTLSLVGSLHYMAPEVIRSVSVSENKNPERMSDWWSVGIILYEMVVGYLPFYDLNEPRADSKDEKRLLEQKKQTEERILNWEYHLRFPPDTPKVADHKGVYHELSEETIALIRGFICDSSKRLCRNGIQGIQDHAFFKGINWDNIRSEPAPYIPELRDELDTGHRIRNSSGANNSVDIPMNGFTFRNFWETKPKPFLDS